MVSIKREDLGIGGKLDSGGFGTVFSGIWKTENKRVAIKKLFEVNLQEVEILKQLRHPNIVTYFGFVHEDTDLMIVMELCELGSLRSYLKHQKAPLPPALIFDWMLQSALPVKYLRDRHNIEHMDIKTDNYVITSKMILKLTDFGISEILEKTKSFSSDAGSWRWMPPERLRDKKLSPKFTIYALSLVFWCLFTRELPFSKYASDYSIAKAVIDDKERPIIPASCPKPIAELIEAGWSDDRTKRPDIADVIITILLNKSALKTPAQKNSMTQTRMDKFVSVSTQSECTQTRNASTQTSSNTNVSNQDKKDLKEEFVEIGKSISIC